MDRSYSFEALLTVLLAAVLLFAPAGLYGQSLYEQAPTISYGLFSNAGGLIAADQFVLKETAAITAVRCWGFFQNPSIVLSAESAAARSPVLPLPHKNALSGTRWE
jgi:hypothetical protein